MKKFRKALCFSVTLAMICTTLYSHIIPATAAAKPTVVSENVNVAKGKSVSAENAQLDIVSSFDAMVDGDETTPIYVFTNKDADGKTTDSEGNVLNSSITVDLGMRYNVKRIEFTTVANSGAKQCFELLGSNDENFAVYDTLYKVGGFVNTPDENTDFSDNKLTLTLDGDIDYRYIRIKRNAYAWIQINELAVYADELFTEVSRNADVKANTTWTGYSPAAAVDGKNGSNTDGWQSDYSDVIDGEKYMWLNIDLGNTYSIAKIEIESIFDGYANGGTDYSIRRGWSIYGSNIAPINSELQKVEVQTTGVGILKADGYDRLATTYGTIPSYNSGADIDGKKYSMSDCDLHWNSGKYEGETGIISQNISGHYRYITLHRGLPSLSSIGEVRVYTPNVQANCVRIEDKRITVSFSGEMSAETMNSDNIILKNSEGKVLAQTNTRADKYEYSFTADAVNAGEKYTLTVSDGLKSSSGLALSEKIFDITATVAAEVEVKIFDGDGTEQSKLAADTDYSVKVQLISNLSETKDVVIIIAEKDANDNLVKACAYPGKMKRGENDITLSYKTGATVGTSFEIYVWDANSMKPYTTKTVK